MNRRWICTDVWMDTLPFFDRPQLGLKLAILSPRFNALVDKHFDGKSELTIWSPIKIEKMETKAKFSVVTNRNAKHMQFPLPDRPMHNKIRFNFLQIEYIDHSVVDFLRANQQIFDKGTKLDLHLPLFYKAKNVQPIWDVFVRQIWPIFAPNIRHLGFQNGDHLDYLRRLISPSILTGLNHLNSIRSNYLLPAEIADDGPNATAGQTLSKWLNIPRSDGKPKQLSCCTSSDTSESKRMIKNLKEAFLRATTPSVSYKIRLALFEPTRIESFELMNERTNERLTLEKDKEDDAYEYANDHLVLKRWQIGRTIQWEEKKTDNLNNVIFDLNECFISRMSPPKAGQKNAKNRLKMKPGHSGEQKK